MRPARFFISACGLGRLRQEYLGQDEGRALAPCAALA